MIALSLDPSDTRPVRAPAPVPARTSRLRVALFALAGAGALGGFGVAASTVMAGLAAPAPIKRAVAGRAADWPDLKDGQPILAGTAPVAPVPARTEPEAPALRIAALPDPVGALPAPTKIQAAPARTAAVAVKPTEAAKAEPAPKPEPAKTPEAATQRIPTATPVAAIGPVRQAVPLPPARAASLQPPKASETVRARTLAEPAPAPLAAASTPAAVPNPAAAPDKPAKKVAAVRKPVAAASAATASVATSVAAAEAPESEDTEVLGIKLPSLAPAGRKLKEGVEALGDAVRNVF